MTLSAPATDLDGDILTWSAAGLPPGLAINPATGLISGTITYDASSGSPYVVVLRVEDPDGLIDSDAFTWSVADTNRAPIFAEPAADQSSAEGQAVSLPMPAGDPDGDLLAWSAAGLPPGLAINPATGVISGTISYDASPASPYLVVVRVADPGGLSAFDSFAWSVADTNRAARVDRPRRPGRRGGPGSDAGPGRPRPRRGHPHLVGHGLAPGPGHRPRLRGGLRHRRVSTPPRPRPTG